MPLFFVLLALICFKAKMYHRKLKVKQMVGYASFWVKYCPLTVFFILIFCKVFTAFFAPPDTFGQKIFDLPVYRTEIIFRPRGNIRIKLMRQPEQYLFFWRGRHISKDFPNLLSAARRGFRRAQPADLRP